MLITGALIVGTAALVVATGGIGAACVPGLIAATAGGALIGAGGNVVGQMIANGSMDLSQIDWGSVALSGLAGGATGLLSATGAGPVVMGIMGGVSSGASEIYHQMQSGEDINWGQVAIRTLGGAVSGAVLGNVGSQTASGAKEIAKNAGKVFLANGGVSFAENLTYNLMGGEDLGTAAKQASFSALISGGTSAGFYALGQAAKNMCFVEGTMVLTAAGFVAIESIAVGDMVIATDPETGETAEKQVKNTFINETEELAHVFVDDEEIVCTPGHKFYAPEKGWTSAIKLRAGDQLQLVNGEYVTVEKVQHELLEEPVKVYNFEVEDFHTYYVGADCSVLVHNEGCNQKNSKPLSEWLEDDPELLAETREIYAEFPEWWGIDPDSTDVYYRTPDEVKAIRNQSGESGGHHPHGLALGGQKGQKFTPTGETIKTKNSMHSKVTGLQRRVINKIKKKMMKKEQGKK